MSIFISENMEVWAEDPGANLRLEGAEAQRARELLGPDGEPALPSLPAACGRALSLTRS